MMFMNACREYGFKEVGVMPIPKRAANVPKVEM
jgi:hypothetical protein